MNMKVSEFIDDMLENKNSNIILFDDNKSNIVFNGKSIDVPECLLNRRFSKIEYNNKSFLLLI